ncbi:MAG: efflux RND transporter periplasmic adaptor subunit [Pontibacterium sp.]
MAASIEGLIRPIVQATLMFYLFALSAMAHSAEAPPAIAVDVVAVSAGPVYIDESIAGRVAAFQVAEVRPQVSGLVTERLFEEGAQVNAGDILYQIDPASYQAALASAQAALAVAEAQAYGARQRAARIAKLINAKAVSKQEADDAVATRKEAEAQILAARAQVRSAKINLDYTQVKAPITGVISRSNITVGSLVTAQQSSPLTTIRKLSPAYVDLQRTVEAVIGMKQTQPESVPVAITLSNGQQYGETGVLSFTDSEVNEGTGTVSARAQFANNDRVLLPGMFVQATLKTLLAEQAMLVPQKAVIRIKGGGAVVMLVNSDDIVESRPVNVGKAIGNRWVVMSGLTEGERIIVNGLQKAKAGSKVMPQLLNEKSE